MFPLLNLPLLPLEKIMKRIASFELLNFSLLSNRCTTAAQLANCKVDAVKWSLHGREIKITIGKPYSPATVFVVVDANSSNHRLTKFSIETRREEYSDMWIVSESATMLDTLEKLSAHVVKIFNAKELHLDVRNSSSSLPDFWHGLNLSFKTFYCDSEFHDIVIDSDSMMLLLQNMKTEAFSFGLKVAPGFQYSKPLKYKYLTVRFADWFTLDNLLNMECKLLGILHSNITTEDLNVFFEKWKQGGFPKLKWLGVCYPQRGLFDLRFQETNERNKPMLRDVHGNRGILRENELTKISFVVKSRFSN